MEYGQTDRSTFFRPKHLEGENVPFGQLLGEFAVFWDADVPRFGEEGASGWCHTSTAASSSAGQSHPALDIQDWHAAETAADRSQNRSSRLSVDVEPDPFRCVIFEDLLPVLFPIESPEVRIQAIYSFLTFVGIHVSPPDEPTARAADHHQFWKLGASPTLRSRTWPEQATGLSLPWRDTVKPQAPAFACPIKSWIRESRTMISTGNWFQDISADDLADIDVPLIR